jgi:hypothetical protein
VAAGKKVAVSDPSTSCTDLATERHRLKRRADIWQRRKRKKAARRKSGLAASGSSTSPDATPTNKPGGVKTPLGFARRYRQSWSSNYCGVYATGILLSLLDLETSRESAKELFLLDRFNPGYLGASLDDVRAALKRTGLVRASRWKFFKHFQLKVICDALLNRPHIYPLPTLLYFGIIHGRLGSRAKHFSVITSARRNQLALLDPLAKPGIESRNVLIREGQPGSSSRPEVIGCNYFVNERAEAALLSFRF